MKSVGIFGGTFNPVHIGHLRTAVELREALQVDEMRLLPCALPAHRTLPGVTAEHRMAMLNAAIAGEAGLTVDDSELRRQTLQPGIPSYTIDTLIALRAQIGDQAKICLCVGMDSLVNLSTWHRWRELLDYAHIVVAARPGWQVPRGCAVARLIDHYGVAGADLLVTPAGNIWLAEMTLLPVSSTEIRNALQAKHSVRYVLPDSVINYIDQHDLY